MSDDDMTAEEASTATATDDAAMDTEPSEEQDAPAGEDDSASDAVAGEGDGDGEGEGDGDGDGDIDGEGEGEGDIDREGDGDEDPSTAPNENDDEEEDESKSLSTTTNNAPDEDGEDDEESKSVGTEQDQAPEEDEGTDTNWVRQTTSTATETTTEAPAPEPEPEPVVAPPVKKKRGKPQIPASARKGRAPAVKGLNIPFRTVKKAMKLDPDIPIVQNEAAIMTTLAAELFLKRLANQSQKICKNRGKNTIRYEDVADARANDPSLAFLKTIIP